LAKISVEEHDALHGRDIICFTKQVLHLAPITTNKEIGWLLAPDDEAVYRIDRGNRARGQGELAREILSSEAVLKCEIY
jgi:hypothetical protein